MNKRYYGYLCSAKDLEASDISTISKFEMSMNLKLKKSGPYTKKN